jgi:carboxylesterase
MKRIMSGAEPFFFPGGRTGCLLIHGFTGTPFEMRELGQHLARQGFSVLAPRLFAHATTQEDMQRARWSDWIASVEDGYDLLCGTCDKIVPIGLSMGGILTIIAAARYQVAGAVVMSAPYNPPDARMPLLHAVAPLLSVFWRFNPKGAGDWHDKQAGATHLEYPANSVRGAAELYGLLLESQRALPQVRCPVLIVQSRQDATVHWRNAELIYERVGSSDKQMLCLDDSGHVVTRDAERQRVFEATAAFVRRVSSGKG